MNKTNKLFFILFFSVTTVFLVRYQTNHLNVRDNAKKEIFFYKKIQNSGLNDVVFVGDSRTYHAANPEIFQIKFPQKIIMNLALPSAVLTQDYLDFINQKLRKNSTIFISITPISLTAYDKNFILNSHIKDQSKFSLITPTFLCIERVSYPLNFISLLKGTQSVWKFPSDDIIYHPNGWAEYIGTTMHQNATQSYIGTYKSYKVSQEIVNKLFQQITIWVREGHVVFTYYLKGNPELTSHELKKENTMFDLEMIKDLSRSSGATWLETKSDYQTFDGDHYGSEEAKKFSEEILSQLK
jgi:hypothetical protein